MFAQAAGDVSFWSHPITITAVGVILTAAFMAAGFAVRAIIAGQRDMGSKLDTLNTKFEVREALDAQDKTHRAERQRAIDDRLGTIDREIAGLRAETQTELGNIHRRIDRVKESIERHA